MIMSVIKWVASKVKMIQKSLTVRSNKVEDEETENGKEKKEDTV